MHGVRAGSVFLGVVLTLFGLAACESDAAPAACGDDFDCKGDRICVAGRCVDRSVGGGDAEGADGGGDDAGASDARGPDVGPGGDVPADGAPLDASDAVRISGQVYDSETQAPIAGAFITTEPAIGQVRTDADGRYELRSSLHGGLEVGTLVRISASAAGYHSNFAQVRADRDVRHVDIPLQPTTPSECLTAADWDLAGDGACDLALFWDADCLAAPDEALDLRCGKDQCHFNVGICESMEPCGATDCLDAGWVARPCPNDPDCVPDLAEQRPPLPCEPDGHCDTWCPVRGDESIDSDCGAGEGGAYCPGGSDAAQCAADVTFHAVVKDFQTRISHADATCWLRYDVHHPDPARAGARVHGVDLPAGFTQPLVSGPGGRFTVTLPAGSDWGFECDKADGDTFRTTFTAIRVPDAPTAADMDVWIVPNGLYNLAPALADVTLDTTRGVVLGRLGWPDPATGQSEYVGCAIVSTDAATPEVRYFGDNDLPVPTAEGGGRDSVNPLNGLYFVMNIPPGRVELTASLEGEVLARSAALSAAGTVSVLDLVTGRSLGQPMVPAFTENPTPAPCE